MKTVRCIRNDVGAGTFLTQGKTYTVSREETNYYFLTDDQGHKDGAWAKSRFEVVEPGTAKINTKALSEAIDAMTSVCAKGKEEIKTVLALGFGIEFTKPKPKFKVQVNGIAQIFKMGTCYYALNHYGTNDCVLLSLSAPGTRYSEGRQSEVIPKLQKWVDDGLFVPVQIDIKITEKG